MLSLTQIAIAKRSKGIMGRRKSSKIMLRAIIIGMIFVPAHSYFYRKAVPFFLGLILGHFITRGTWTIIRVILNQPI